MEKIKYNQDARVRNINAEIKALYDAVNELINEVNALKEKANEKEMAKAGLQKDAKGSVRKSGRPAHKRDEKLG